MNADGSGRRQLTDSRMHPEGFSETTVSPDGGTAYAISFSNRVVKINIATDRVTEIASRTPVVSSCGYGTIGDVPGSMSSCFGSGLSDDTAIAAGAPLPISLAGAKVQVNGLDAPIISAQRNEVRFQIPFETPLGPAAIVFPSDSPFVQNPASFGRRQITAWDITYLPTGSETGGIYADAYAIHEDFSSVVTLTNPAHPHEVVHFYAVGLGPVTLAVASGQTGPLNPPAAVVNQPICLMNDATSGVPVAVRFAGLAPGLNGIYQLDLQLPDSFWSRAPTSVIFCNVPGGAFVSGVVVDTGYPE